MGAVAYPPLLLCEFVKTQGLANLVVLQLQVVAIV